MTEWYERSAIELADLIRRREVSSREVMASFLAPVQQVNPSVNAITVVLAERASPRSARCSPRAWWRC
jgi:amidase